MNNVLFISPHLDDETFGCGGTIISHKQKKDNIYWINVTLPADINKKKRRINEYHQIIELYGFNNSFLLEYNSTELEGKFKELINSFTDLFNEIHPNIIYLPNRSDIHSDHKQIFNAAYSCTKNFRFPFINRILMYEVLSETDYSTGLINNSFHPNVFIDITEYFEKKKEALSIYIKELMEENFPRSINTVEALARYRGSRIGVKYAESFMMLFEKQ